MQLASLDTGQPRVGKHLTDPSGKNAELTSWYEKILKDFYEVRGNSDITFFAFLSGHCIDGGG